MGYSIWETFSGALPRSQSVAPHVGANWVNPHLGVNLGANLDHTNQRTNLAHSHWGANHRHPIWEPIQRPHLGHLTCELNWGSHLEANLGLQS